MTHKYRAYIAMEFKNYKVDAPTVRQIWGTASLQNLDGQLLHIVIWCQGFTRDAAKVADNLKKKHRVNIIFKIKNDDAENSPA